MDAATHMDQIRSLRAKGYLSEAAAELHELHERFVGSRFFRMNEMERVLTMQNRGWTRFPCEEMFPPSGTMEVLQETAERRKA